MSLMENSNQVILDNQLQHFIETETKKQEFQVSKFVQVNFNKLDLCCIFLIFNEMR